MLALDGVRGPGFRGATGPPHAVKMRSLLILAPEEANPSELPHRQKPCGSEYLSLAPTSTPDDRSPELALQFERLARLRKNRTIPRRLYCKDEQVYIQSIGFKG